VLATIYAWAVTRHRSRQVARWTQRLSAFRARFPEAKVDRIAEFLDMETRRLPAQFAEHGASFPGITQRPFHDDFPRLRWMLELEENFEQVRKELLAVIQQATTEEYGWFSLQKQFKQFRLYSDGRPNQVNCAKCPKTAEILSAVSTNSDVLCTILHPGSRLKNHIDFASPTLVYQLGVKIPPDCGIRVGTETRSWQEGKSMVFDNAYEHEVWNDSSEPRVVLLVDFFHPELTETERRFFKGQLEDAPSPVQNEKPAAAV
jgi:aspartyl/asparaginyl beta-hydroxylase (cupin superfamily)